MSSPERPPLDVHLYGTHIGRLDAEGNRVTWRWSLDASARWGLGARTVSDLLPIQRAGTSPHSLRVSVFLAGLLAEGNLREHLAFEAGVLSDDIFGLISQYGKDTAGALLFVPAGSTPGPLGTWESATDTQIAARLRAAGRFSPDIAESTSLAGVQPKIVLRRHDGLWYRCLGGAPSTHIVKLAHPVASPIADVIDTEAAALDLARTLGLTTISADVTTFEDVRALVVSRYDRHSTSTGEVVRIHQEDTAQALGINTADLNRKFQRGKQLPSLTAIAAVLRNGGAEPDRLLALTTFNLAIGNSDAHAKNISLLRHPDGTAELAPAYDVAMHAHHPGFSAVFAMDVSGSSRMLELTGSDLVAEGMSWPLPRRRAVRVVRSTLEQLLQAVPAVDRRLHPGVGDEAWEAVTRRTAGLLVSLT